jgi:hypothetical protein
MRQTAFVLLFIIAPAVLLAQEEGNRKPELSISASMQNVSSGGGSSSTSFLLAPRIGFFLYQGLQLEPEAVLLLSSASPAYMLNGNLVYNFSGESKRVPFLLAGYGIANTVPIFNVPAFLPDFAFGVLNLGFGMKVFLAENVAIRGEYRFQKFSGEGKTQNYGYFSYTSKVDTRIHSFQFGIVVAL